MNILIVTPYFPSPDFYRERSEDPRTRFLYDYAIEWYRQGHQVIVLHFAIRYPGFAPSTIWFLENIFRFKLRHHLRHPEAVRRADYQSEGVFIHRFPVTKWIPHRDYSARTTKRLIGCAQKMLGTKAREVDVILSDFFSPSLFIATGLSAELGVPFFQAMHEADLHYLRRYPARMLPALGNARAMLFRSKAMMDQGIRNGIPLTSEPYIMYSGIPGTVPMGSARTHVRRLLYVGSLIPRKRVNVLLEALAEAKVRDRFHLTVVGQGPCEGDLRAQAAKLQLEDRVSFLGQVTRDKVFEAMGEADAFIMVSVDTFGMVYVEAMSQGCVPVAAVGQGMDGLIVDGINGFLVELDDAAKLASVLHKLGSLNGAQVHALSTNALHTVREMRNDSLARNLVNDVFAPNVIPKSGT